MAYHESIEEELKKNIEGQVDVVLKMEEERLLLLRDNKEIKAGQARMQAEKEEVQKENEEYKRRIELFERELEELQREIKEDKMINKENK